MSINLNAIPNFDAQMAHIGWGAALTLAIALKLPWELSAVSVTVFAASKESIESLWGVWEPVQQWNDGLTDFAFFLVGIVPSAIALYKIKGA